MTNFRILPKCTICLGDIGHKTLKTIALKTTTFIETTLNQGLRSLSEQLSVKLWEYNAKLILRIITLEHDLAFWDVFFSR